jgi:hypothetical protein
MKVRAVGDGEGEVIEKLKLLVLHELLDGMVEPDG